MARSCLFTYTSLVAVNLKKNCIGKFQFRRLEIKNAGVACFHSLPSTRQEEQFHNQETFKNEEEHSYEDLKSKILKAGLDYVPEHGWSERSLAFGVKSLGLSPAAHTLVEEGGAALVSYFNYECNMKLEDHLKEVSSKSEKLDLQEFLTQALEYRLRLVIPFVTRWPEAMALMVLPSQVPIHANNMLQLVDSIWHYYGDKSLDMSWYGKRLALLAAYKASELSLIQDKSDDYMDTFEFLERRVQNVLEAGEVAESINTNLKQLEELNGGIFITARNVLGLRKWLS